jgi:hypothetical protein
MAIVVVSLPYNEEGKRLEEALKQIPSAIQGADVQVIDTEAGGPGGAPTDGPPVPGGGPPPLEASPLAGGGPTPLQRPMPNMAGRMGGGPPPGGRMAGGSRPGGPMGGPPTPTRRKPLMPHA